MITPSLTDEDPDTLVNPLTQERGPLNRQGSDSQDLPFYFFFKLLSLIPQDTCEYISLV